MRRSIGLLHAVAQIAVVVGAVGSVVLMLWAGHRNRSGILLILFVGWVLSPFVGLALADRASMRWSVPTRATLHGLMLILTLVSLAIYSGVVPRPAGWKPAAVFLIVPLVSWLLMAIALPIAGWVSGRLSRRHA
jgi:hypothetical protein